MVVHPPPRDIARRDGFVRGAVDEPANRVRLPLDRKHVKGVGERARAQVVGAADAVGTRVVGAGRRAVHPARLLPDVLHDVDLAAAGPADLRDVVAQHPERGPQPLPPRDLNARLDPAVAPRPQALGLEARRGVGLVAERLAPGLDHEVTVFEARVFDPIGIELELAVPPAVAPVSRTHFVVSSAAPSNSSCHTSRHGGGVWEAPASWSPRQANIGLAATRAMESTRTRVVVTGLA